VNESIWIDRLVQCAQQARRNGIVSLEAQADQLGHPFLRKALMLAVDGVDTREIRSMLELELRLLEDRTERDAKVFEAAGGYAPTIGIIGAVMGLIQVMKQLDNISEVGKGIAVAFVATVYGVGFANLVLLPAAMKIRARARMESTLCELMLEGVVSIAEGLNPKLIRDKLESFLEDPPVRRGPSAVPEASAVKAARS
jgi:chemotaxis protein MotA